MVLLARGGYSQIAAKMRDSAIAGRQRNVCNAVVFTQRASLECARAASAPWRVVAYDAGRDRVCIAARQRQGRLPNGLAERTCRTDSLHVPFGAALKTDADNDN